MCFSFLLLVRFFLNVSRPLSCIAHWNFLLAITLVHMTTCRDVFNVFLGAMLGGSVLAELPTFIQNPSQIWSALSSAIPASSNFFINYVSYRALVMAWFRLFYPHQGIMVSILKWMHILPCKCSCYCIICSAGFVDISSSVLSLNLQGQNRLEKKPWKLRYEIVDTAEILESQF
jgi:hypothetical protein